MRYAACVGSRSKDFRSIQSAIDGDLKLASREVLVAGGDSLQILQSLPASSVTLILTDPPYHATKKANIYGDTAFAKDCEFLEWMAQYAREWRRVLRPNGSLFVFCASAMAARLEVLFTEHFNVLSHIVWTKPNDPGFEGWYRKMSKDKLRQWYPHSERILFAEPAVNGNLKRSPFAHFLRERRKKAGISAHELTERIGAYGTVNHGGAVSNWECGRNIPSKEQYERIREVLGRMPSYEDAVRVFQVNAQAEYTDVWTFPSVRPYKGKHPAEKPVALLEHAIGATTLPGDIVLDCFAGSGNTALAAKNLKRRAVVLEIEKTWVSSIVERLRHSGVV